MWRRCPDCWRVLRPTPHGIPLFSDPQRAMTTLHKRGDAKFSEQWTYICNPKSITMGQVCALAGGDGCEGAAELHGSGHDGPSWSPSQPTPHGTVPAGSVDAQVSLSCWVRRALSPRHALLFGAARWLGPPHALCVPRWHHPSLPPPPPPIACPPLLPPSLPPSLIPWHAAPKQGTIQDTGKRCRIGTLGIVVPCEF